MPPRRATCVFMVSKFFGGLSFSGEERLICRKMASAAQRWPFVKLKTGSSAPGIDLDWIHLLRRIPHFTIWGPYVWNSAFRVAMPFMNFHYVKAVTGLSSRQRLGPFVHASVIKFIAASREIVLKFQPVINNRYVRCVVVKCSAWRWDKERNKSKLGCG